MDADAIWPRVVRVRHGVKMAGDRLVALNIWNSVNRKGLVGAADRRTLSERNNERMRAHRSDERTPGHFVVLVETIA